jgi:hypothetical protein
MAMLLPLAIAFWAQTTVTVTAGALSPRDSARIARDRAKQDSAAARADSIRTVREAAAAKRRQAARLPVTADVLATAFRDQRARELLARARTARLSQDSSLTNYDATMYERLSAGMGVGRLSRERLLFRSERASRVRWDRTKGAVVDITGARAVVPVSGGDGTVDVGDNVPIPYFPGRDALWTGSGLAKADVSETDVMNPLANGAEAYYTYATGDSLSFHLAGDRRVVVRELRVRPRTPKWNVVVGSLWFDVASGQLVRAVYRMSEPIDVMAQAREEGDDDIPAIARAFIPSITAQINVITVDYGLFEGRYWLPREQTAEGRADVGPLRVPVTIGQRFDYSVVNGTVDVPSVTVTAADTAKGVNAIRARRLRAEQACEQTSATRERAHQWYEGSLAVVVRTPCDSAKLAHAPTLPPSIYTSDDTLFGSGERDAMIASALSLGEQSDFAPRPVTVRYGLPYTRYNRVEGPSTALDVQQHLGAGYTTHLQLRLGAADLSPNVETGLSRSNGRRTVSLGVYRRLAAANDWSDPLTLRASLSALLFGRDDGFYYRSWGAELKGESVGGVLSEWRIFGEQEFNAPLQTTFSFARAINGNRFRPNITTQKGSVAGIALRRSGSLGEDPAGTRLFSDIRVEGAFGTFDYGRAMADLTLARPIFSGIAGSVTLSGGTSTGELPTQKLWYLGGTATVRGQPAGAMAGDAYWFTRFEVGPKSTGFKPVIFTDLGWAGDRNRFNNGQTMGGAGIGFSFLDGLIRADLAKGFHPTRGVSAALYLDARF